MQIICDCRDNPKVFFFKEFDLCANSRESTGQFKMFKSLKKYYLGYIKSQLSAYIGFFFKHTYRFFFDCCHMFFYVIELLACRSKTLEIVHKWIFRKRQKRETFELQKILSCNFLEFNFSQKHTEICKNGKSNFGNLVLKIFYEVWLPTKKCLGIYREFWMKFKWKKSKNLFRKILHSNLLRPFDIFDIIV